VPSSLRRALALLGALLGVAAAGCHRADPTVVPFAIRLAGPAGQPVLPNVTPGDVLVLVEGSASLAGPGELRVADATLGLVTVTFDAAAHPFVAFPDQLDGQQVRVHAQYDAEAVAPGGLPIPYPALRVALVEAGASRYQLVLADSPYEEGSGLPNVPRPLLPELSLGDSIDLADPFYPDHPIFLVAAAHARFEAGACGLVYHDVLQAEGAALQAGEEARTVLELSPVPWTTRHVDSWHRVGSCPGRPKTWTQWAAWR
jgi:hypothetical protein